MHCRRRWSTFLLPLLLAYGAFADEPKDHPLFSRYPGSEIKKYSAVEFDGFELPVGPVVDDNDHYVKTLQLEGRVTRIQYTVPENRSSLEVISNYRSALERRGFETLFECAGKACIAPGGSGGKTAVGTWCVDCKGTTRYIAAKSRRPTGDVYVALLINEDSYWGGAWLTVVEVKPMETGLVTVKSAETIDSDLGSSGHSSIYGVFFDTDSAVVKPESAPTLEQIVKLLQSEPDLKLHVVGHTDNTGTFARNMTLSKQRADAVVAEMVGKYKIAAARLDAAGVGSLSPVTTNRTEAGRAKNRRVELVEQ